MSLAEEFLNIANKVNTDRKEEEERKEKEEKKILKFNSEKYWEEFCIPTFKKQVENGVYTINLIFAQLNHTYNVSGPYYPVLPVGVDRYDGTLVYDGIKNSTTHYWYSFSKFWNLPIDIEQIELIAKNDGFFVTIEEELRADTKTGKYTTENGIYNVEISCKPKHRTFRESIILTGQEQGKRINSKGEDKIELLLIDNKINYIHNYKFSNCKYQKPLPFDFAIFSNTGDLLCVIEYDGEQHYHYIEHWHKTEEGFKQQQLRDSIKTDFCKINNIKLIRIPYTEFDNIEQILRNYGII